MTTVPTSHQQQLDAAVTTEREACAQICDRRFMALIPTDDDETHARGLEAAELAARIRRRDSLPEHREVQVMHGDCVGCIAGHNGEDASIAVIAILRMILSGDSTAESVRRDLCFKHRRLLATASQ